MKLSIVNSASALLAAVAWSLALASLPAPTSASEMILYDSPAAETKIKGRSLANYCTNPDTPTSQITDDPTFDAVLQFCTDPWMGGSLEITKSVAPKLPDVSAYTYITFLAKAEYSDSCPPKFSTTCGWWPRYNSNAVELSGDYVAGGKLVPDEWRQVVIPVSDLLPGSDCATYTQFYSVNFAKCNPPPKYWVTDIRLTDDMPSLGTIKPTDKPSDRPSSAPTPYTPTVVWDEFVDDPNDSCLDARNNSTQIRSSNGDYCQLITDSWMGATLQIERQCFFPERGGDTQFNYFSSDESLTFLLKATGDFYPESGACDPVISMSGGSWISGGWSGRSDAVKIEHDVIDYGIVSPDEYRQVSIPMTNFMTDTWDLSDVFSISFSHCPELPHTGREEQPKYYVRDIQVTKTPPSLVTPYPTASPTVRVTEDDSLATHRKIHHHWYPVLGDGHNGDESLWLEADNDQWPTIPVLAGDHEVTVHIPMGSVVTYTENSSIKLDKVVVHGTLIIKPADADVVLTCSTLVVEMMGTLAISTEQNGHTVTIDIDGALNTVSDPEQTMVGLVNLGGMVTISGDKMATKMAQLTAAIDAGSTTLVVDDSSGDAAAGWSVGDELVLPDTKAGLNVAYWNFINYYGFRVPGETETVIISAVTTVGTELHITLQEAAQFGHVAGCHAAHTSRSVTVKTSATSTDRGHVMHTGMGQFDVANARFEGLGRTTTDTLDLTVLEDTGTQLAEGLARMTATHVGTNQIARYALHSHHSMIKVHWSGNAIVDSPRNGMVMHNSFGDITDNVAVGCNGTAIFLESGTESGTVKDNFLIGTGGGTRGHDDGRFASGGGQDMAHGGFGIWARGLLAPIRNNHAEGIFGRAPYAYFVHPLFTENNVVPTVPGTNPALAGKSLKDIFHHQPVSLQTYGPFSGNSAFGTWVSALDLSYFGGPGVGVGHIIKDFTFNALASSGQGIFMVHSSAFDMVDCNFKASYPGNDIVAEFCNNGKQVLVYYNDTVVDGFGVDKQSC